MIVTVRREPGNNPYPSIIIHPLLLHEYVAVHKGKQILNDEGFDKENYTVETIHKGYKQCGSLIGSYVDESLNKNFIGRITSWEIQINTTAEGVVEVTQFFDIERSITSNE